MGAGDTTWSVRFSGNKDVVVVRCPSEEPITIVSVAITFVKTVEYQSMSRLKPLSVQA